MLGCRYTSESDSNTLSGLYAPIKVSLLPRKPSPCSPKPVKKVREG